MTGSRLAGHSTQASLVTIRGQLKYCRLDKKRCRVPICNALALRSLIMDEHLLASLDRGKTKSKDVQATAASNSRDTRTTVLAVGIPSAVYPALADLLSSRTLP